MSEVKFVKGYKVFNSDRTCRGKQYTCPGKFEENAELSVCNSGMHFCKKAADCFNYYGFNPKNKAAEVAAYGDVEEKGNKCCTNKLEIVREIPWIELLEIVNTGKDCTGLNNSGDYNSGDYNSGDRNSGNRNSGDYNSGNCNSGNCNSGDYNSGNYNSGDCNSGNCNSGDYNSGYWNKCSFSNGCFNTIEPKIYLFNKPSEWTYKDWIDSDACYLLNQIQGSVLEYVRLENMTDEEKTLHPEAEVTGGYLKKTGDSESAVIWWRGLSKSGKAVITAIPNFDKTIFKELTGIDVDENLSKVD